MNPDIYAPWLIKEQHKSYTFHLQSIKILIYSSIFNALLKTGIKQKQVKGT